MPARQYLYPSGASYSCFTAVASLKAKQAPRGEVESVVHEEVCYTPEELNEFAIQAEV